MITTDLMDVSGITWPEAHTDAEMMANATNSAKLSELAAKKEQAEADLEAKMERWVYLNDLAEKILTQ